MKIKKINTLILIALISYIALVLFLCLYRFSGSSGLDLGKYFCGIRLDRLVHFTMFFPYPFVAWLYIVYDNKNKIIARHKYLTTLISGVFFAIIAEGSQELLTTYRDADPFDLIANISAICIGTLIIKLLNHYVLKSRFKFKNK